MTATQSRPTKPSEVLEAAALLIEPEGAWTQNFFGLDASGHTCGSADLEKAVCFCAEGALVWAGQYGGRGGLWDAGVDRYLERIIGNDIPNWNDDPKRTQAEVVKALRDAANLARAEGQ